VARPIQIHNASIRMGEMAVARDGAHLRTLLGSCVGLALYDRRQKIGGLAHIVLPNALGKQDRPGKFVDTAIPKLIEEMKRHAEADLKLIAKVAGGANMFANSIASNIGNQNIEACLKLLKHLQIPVVAQSCGGTQGRRMSLLTGDGSVLIEIVGEETIQL
jgi:chemotaxis protein CheD